MTSYDTLIAPRKMSYNPVLAICGRLCVLLWTAGAIFCSIVSIFSCQIITYETKDEYIYDGWNTTLNPPFDELPSASVGLFAYSESTTSDDGVLGDECTAYFDWQKVGQNEFFQIAQWCAIFAPIAAFLAWFQLLLEWCFCRLFGGFCFMSVLLLVAGGLQAATFLILANTDYCFENNCFMKSGAFYSLGAMGGYIIAAAMTPNVLVSQTEDQRGCCIFTRAVDAEKSGGFVERQQFIEEDGRVGLLTRQESVESTSIVIQSDGKVGVSVRTQHETGPDTVETYVYDDEEAARAAGHNVASWDEGKIEEEIHSEGSADTPMTSNESNRELTVEQTDPDIEVEEEGREGNYDDLPS